MSKTSLGLVLAAGVLVVVLAGCEAQESAPRPGSTAVHAWISPVYRNATFGGTLGSYDSRAPEDAQAWFYRTPDPMARVVEFYDGNFPGAERTHNADGTVTFRLHPEGAAPGEFVRVTVRPGLIEIREESRR